MKGAFPVDSVIFFAAIAVTLAVLGALAMVFGADSRCDFEDTQQAHDAVGVQ